MAKINLTPIFEHVLGISEINSKEDLLKVIEALELEGDKPLFTEEQITAIMKAKGTDEAEEKSSAR